MSSFTLNLYHSQLPSCPLRSPNTWSTWPSPRIASSFQASKGEGPVCEATKLGNPGRGWSLALVKNHWLGLWQALHLKERTGNWEKFGLKHPRPPMVGKLPKSPSVLLAVSLNSVEFSWKNSQGLQGPSLQYWERSAERPIYPSFGKIHNWLRQGFFQVSGCREPKCLHPWA